MRIVAAVSLGFFLLGLYNLFAAIGVIIGMIIGVTILAVWIINEAPEDDDFVEAFERAQEKLLDEAKTTGDSFTNRKVLQTMLNDEKIDDSHPWRKRVEQLWKEDKAPAGAFNIYGNNEEED